MNGGRILAVKRLSTGGDDTFRVFVTPGSLLRAFEREDRRGHAPTRHDELAPLGAVADDQAPSSGKGRPKSGALESCASATQRAEIRRWMPI